MIKKSGFAQWVNPFCCSQSSKLFYRNRHPVAPQSLRLVKGPISPVVIVPGTFCAEKGRYTDAQSDAHFLAIHRKAVPFHQFPQAFRQAGTFF
jgi:hypothetical protein